MSAGTYIPPGPMLNSASTRLACLEDVEIDVSPTGAARRLFRRRVFAPEDNHDERYLTASDVVKVSTLLLLHRKTGPAVVTLVTGLAAISTATPSHADGSEFKDFA